MKLSSRKEVVRENPGVGIYSPWVMFSKEVNALFENDPEVAVEFDNDRYNLILRVDNPEKAEALSMILPQKKVFGTVVVTITVVPPNQHEWKAKYFEKAFEGNDAFAHLTIVQELPDAYISNPIAYCVFKKEVVQYGADDLSSESGMRSTLYQDLAKDVFGDVPGVYFCTDTH